jgi:hypothetical protein
MITGSDQSYVIDDGVLYVAYKTEIDERDGETVFTAKLGSQFRLHDVLNDIRINAMDGFFLPTLSEGRIVAWEKGKSNRGTLFCVEFVPHRRTITLATDIFYLPMRLRLAFPYIYLIVGVKEGRAIYYPYYRNLPLGSMDDMLCYSNFLNMRSSGMCIPKSQTYVSITETLHLLGMAVHHFWTNRYTYELQDLWHQARSLKGHPLFMETWALRSAFPGWQRFITSIPWVAACSLREAFNKHGRDWLR